MKFISQASLSTSVLLLVLLSSDLSASAKDANQGGNPPLGNLDKVMQQANGMKFDAITDSKLASNVTNALNEMAMNLRRMFAENRRLTAQVQDVLQRVQNVTGVNATTTVGSLQQQASNMSNLSNMGGNLNNFMSRFQVPSSN